MSRKTWKAIRGQSAKRSNNTKKLAKQAFYNIAETDDGKNIYNWFCELAGAEAISMDHNDLIRNEIERRFAIEILSMMEPENEDKEVLAE